MEIEGELGSDPLVSTLPACPIQEDVVTVFRDVFDQVVGKPQVGRRQAQHLPQLWVLNLDAGFLHLKD